MKIVVNDANLVPHRQRLEASLPPGARVSWHEGGVQLDELRDADVYVGSRFTAEMANAAEKLRLVGDVGVRRFDTSARHVG
jgi:phosphoglycerate dehydrogenase-like enzyme